MIVIWYCPCLLFLAYRKGLGHIRTFKGIGCQKGMIDQNCLLNKRCILIYIYFFALLVVTLSSCSPMSEIAREKALSPDNAFKICKIGERIGRYRLVTVMDNQNNYYSWIAKDFPYHLKPGDDYPAH